MRTAVLGAGPAGERHAHAFLAHAGRCMAAGVFDPDPGQAAALAQALGCDAFERPEALLARADAAIVAGRVEDRPALARMAIHAGVDVLVEPPAATQAEGIHRVLSAVVRAPRRQVAQLAVPGFHEPVVRGLRELLQGRPLVAIRTERVRPGSGAKGDLLDEVLLGDVHVVLALARGSEVLTTQAAGRRLRSGAGPIEHAEVLVNFDDGLVASLVATHAGPTPARRLSVTTQAERFEADFLAGTIEVVRAHGSERLEVVRGDAWVLQAGAFLQAVERRSPPPVGLGIALHAQEVAVAVRKRIALAAHEPVRTVLAA
ncbi:MAG: Gfo/Idh/MocA family oxidoreductase [Solirubrobacterales bacterium]|nr:Gfo/Idh/MocA family oxidoreductase [Solirubrobacterales bacterium]